MTTPFNTLKDKYCYNVTLSSKLYIIFFGEKKRVQNLLEQMLCSKTYGLHFFQRLQGSTLTVIRSPGTT
jgi:hypothetical protein